MKFAKPKLLVYNPNTTQAMTEALKPVLEKLALNMVRMRCCYEGQVLQQR